MTHTTLIEKIAEAIYVARNVRHSDTFGSYDYSNYEGNSPAYVVKAPGQREVVFRSDNPAEATAFWELAEKSRIAQAALTAISDAGYVLISNSDAQLVIKLIEDNDYITGCESVADYLRDMIAQAEKEG